MRNRAVRSAAMLLTVLALIGCDRKSKQPVAASNSSPHSSSTPTAAPIAATPTTIPSTQPASILTIDGKPVQFPAAKLVVTKKDDVLNLILCSDDPPNAIESNYMGNSFMIEMKLDVPDVDQLPTIAWTYKSPRIEPQDSTTGIFLNGARQQLQPIDVKITFEKQDAHMLTSINGKFLILESHDLGGPPQLANVHGQLNATVVDQQ